MSIESLDAIIFDLGDTLYRMPFGFLGTNRQYLIDIGVEGASEFTDDMIRDALQTKAEVWLDQYMIENNVGQYWEPPREVWVEFDKYFLIELGVEGELDSLAEQLQAKWDGFLQEYDTGVADRLIDGSKQTLEELSKRGYKIAMASNRYNDPLEKLKRDGIAHLFEAVEWTNTPGYKKPWPYMLIKCAADMGVNPAKCAYVGNWVEYDMVAAKRAGMLPILTVACNPEERAKASDGILVIEHVSDLLDLVP